MAFANGCQAPPREEGKEEIEMTGWKPGHPKDGIYYMFRGNGYGPFKTINEAREAWADKFTNDPYRHIGPTMHQQCREKKDRRKLK